MFNENLKNFRKSKGFTQEELAIKINVVRQTVSKWEKGLSVPDADALQKIAEVLDVSVGELLGAEMQTKENRNEIAEQLSRINEQLVIKNRRWNRFWKVVAGILIGFVILIVLCFVLIGALKFSGSSVEQVEQKVIYEGESVLQKLTVMGFYRQKSCVWCLGTDTEARLFAL